MADNFLHGIDLVRDKVAHRPAARSDPFFYPGFLRHIQYQSDMFQKRDRLHHDDAQYSFLLFYVLDLCIPAGNKSMSLAHSLFYREAFRLQITIVSSAFSGKL